ncbi:MAG: DNA mismatch repair protein MutL, partial [Geobacteraceae bacterium]|nr:DNA mismatch repair protein MutL [Geobacteraceae bacterium]
AIQAAVESVLRETPWIRRAPAPSPPPPSSASAVRVAEVRESLVEFGVRNAECGIKDEEPRFSHSALRIPHSALETPHSALETPHSALRTRELELKTQNSKLKTASEGYFSGLTVIGQFNAAYILCQDGPELVVIDQHAAHERVAFERLKSQFSAGGVESQGLLFPETLELSFREGGTLAEHGSELGRLGYELEPFGGATWLLKGVPRLLAGGDYLRILRDILEELAGLGRSRSFADAQEEVLSRIACHSVVRGSHALTTPEIIALLARMDAAEFSSNCPHGRPVFHKIGLAEIERMFKRQ